MKSDRTGVTRIELIVAIAIVVLVPAVITASLGTARNLAKIPLCANNLRQIGAAVYEYAQIYDGNLPNVVNLEGDEEYHMYVLYRSDGPRYVRPDGSLLPLRLACLYEAGLMDDPRIFYCPANTDPARMFQSYNNPSPWGTLPQVWNSQHGTNQWVRAGYEWFPVDKNPILGRPIGGRPRAPERLCRKFDNLDPNLPYCTDVIRTRSVMSHQSTEFVGVNALYKDGRVVFCSDPNVFSLPAWDLDPSGRTTQETMSIYYERILLLAGKHPSQGN